MLSVLRTSVLNEGAEENLGSKSREDGMDKETKPAEAPQAGGRRMGDAAKGTLSDPRPIDPATFNLPTGRTRAEDWTTKTPS